jgi:hypothetical protein
MAFDYEEDVKPRNYLLFPLYLLFLVLDAGLLRAAAIGAIVSR